MRQKRAAFFNVNDLITFGKYQNKPGKIVRFLDDGKGNPMIEVEPVPKGLKHNKIMPLFRIRHLVAPKKVAERFMQKETMAQRQALDFSSPEALKMHKEANSKTALRVACRFIAQNL